MSGVRAVVADDHPVFRSGLRLLLDGRRVTDASGFTGVPRLTIGGGESVSP